MPFNFHLSMHPRICYLVYYEAIHSSLVCSGLLSNFTSLLRNIALLKSEAFWEYGFVEWGLWVCST